MKNNLRIQAKNNYGTVVYYPMCDKSKALAALAGTKTLTLHALKQAKALGYDLTVTIQYGGHTSEFPLEIL